MSNFFGSSTGGGTGSETELGSRLYHIKESAIGSEAILSILPDDNVVINNCSHFGKSLLNISSLAQLTGMVLSSADTKAEIIDSSGTGEINFTLDNALKLKVMNAYTEVLNELISRNIGPDETHLRDIGSNSKYYNIVYGKTMVCKNGNGENVFTGNQILLNWKAAAPALGDNYSHAIKTRHKQQTNDGNAIDFYLWQTGQGINEVGTKQVMSITGTGVGIGTTYASAQLHIVTPTSSSVASFAKSGGGLNTKGCFSEWVDSDGDGRFIVGCDGTGLKAIDQGAGVIGTWKAKPILFITNETEKMRITSSGNVGIGRTSPATALDVNGYATLRPSTSGNGAIKIKFPTSANGDSTWIGFTGDGTDANDRARFGCVLNSGGGGALYFTSGGSGSSTERLRIDGNYISIPSESSTLDVNGVIKGGVVQIGGSSNLTEKLMITGGHIGINSANDTSGIAKIVFYHNPWVAGNPSQNTGRTAIITESIADYGKSKMHFCLNNSTGGFTTQVSKDDARMTIIPSGNIGLGKSSPNALLHLEKQYDSGSTLWEASNIRFNARSGATPWGLGEISSYVKAGPNNSSSSFPGGLLFKTKPANSTSDEALSTRMCIDSRGYIGVGTTIPKYNFHINPSNTTSGWTASENNRGLMITDGTVVRMVLENTSNTSNQRLLVLGNEGNEFRVGVLNDTDGGNTWNKQHIIRASLSTGNVGIGFDNGSSEATEKLEVNGSAKFTGNILVDGDNTRNVGSNGHALSKIYAHEGNFQSIVVHSNTAGSIGENNKPFATIYGTNIYGSTKIGVGTTSANMPLHINTGSATSAYSAGTQNGVLITADTYPSLVLENTGGSNGYKQLAIQNQDGALHLGFQSDDGSGWNKQSLYRFSFQSENFWCKSNILPPSGSYNLGTATNNWNEGHFNVVYTGSGTVSVSDRNKKKDIVDLDNALNTVMKLKPVSYKFIDGTSGRTHTGFIAQDCENLVCDNWAGFVKHEDNYGLRYEEFIALNSRAIQELNQRLDALEVRGPVVLENQPVRAEPELPSSKPQLHRCVEISRINELYDRVSALESNEVKGSSVSEDIELIHTLMDKVNQLEVRNNELEQKVNSIPKLESKSNEILESDGGINMVDLLQQKNFELETRLAKLEKQNKKLVSAVNKLLRTTTIE